MENSDSDSEEAYESFKENVRKMFNNLDRKYGILNEDAKIYFMGGQCHSLAYAINKKHGFPIYAIEIDIGVVHVVCKIGTDTFVDIQGVKTAKALKDHFIVGNTDNPGHYKFYEITDFEVLENDWGLLPIIDPQYAESLVDLVIP